jgi:hypothetical protein
MSEDLPGGGDVRIPAKWATRSEGNGPAVPDQMGHPRRGLQRQGMAGSDCDGLSHLLRDDFWMVEQGTGYCFAVAGCTSAAV